MTIISVRGAKYLLSQPRVPRLAIVTAYEHHMMLDMMGTHFHPALTRNFLIILSHLE